MPVWFEAHAAYLCGDCPRDIEPGDLAAWLPDDGDGAVVCLDCGEREEEVCTTTGS